MRRLSSSSYCPRTVGALRKAACHIMRSIITGLAALAGLLATARSHGMMNRPSPRNNRQNEAFSNLTGCAGNACYWYQVGCMSGCRCAGWESAIVTTGFS